MIQRRNCNPRLPLLVLFLYLTIVLSFDLRQLLVVFLLHHVDFPHPLSWFRHPTDSTSAPATLVSPHDRLSFAGKRDQTLHVTDENEKHHRQRVRSGG